MLSTKIKMERSMKATTTVVREEAKASITTFLEPLITANGRWIRK